MIVRTIYMIAELTHKFNQYECGYAEEYILAEYN